ncbi:MAG TPA: alpha-hydroxy acid oxidase [Streptosporangiaceae bacterium]
MHIREVAQLLRMRPVELDPVTRRLARCRDLDDLRECSRRLTPRPVFDYVDGGADDELSMAANRAALTRWRFMPRVLVDVSAPDTSAQVLGQTLPLPLVLAPTGFTRMVHPDGEAGVARVAARHGLPYTLSTMATTSIEDLAAAAGPDRWFQLYLLKDSGLSNELVDRAAASGYRVLVVTVDTVVSGHRSRDLRNGLVIPPELTVGSIASIATRPGYWLRMLRSPAVAFANFAQERSMTIGGSISRFSTAISWDDIAALRERWPGRLVIKGPLGPADARRAAQAGADGIQLSNHGGRQLDRAVAPADLIAGAREAAGPGMCILTDSGIRHGADIATAIALGADAAAIGRAYLYGLMAGGERGVDKALTLLASQFRRTLQLLGVTSVAELSKHGQELLTRD